MQRTAICSYWCSHNGVFSQVGDTLLLVPIVKTDFFCHQCGIAILRQRKQQECSNDDAGSSGSAGLHGDYDGCGRVHDSGEGRCADRQEGALRGGRGEAAGGAEVKGAKAMRSLLVDVYL